MSITIQPPPTARPVTGTLGFKLFQHAYVVRDLGAAIEIFKNRYGFARFTMVKMPPMQGGLAVRIALAWSAGLMTELIEARGPGLELYTDWLAGGADIRLHHFGYLIETDEQWSVLEALLAAEGRPHLFGGDSPLCRFVYVYAPELGHYLEYVYPTPEGKAFFESGAAN